MRLALGQLAAVALQLDVPAEGVHPRRHLLEDLPGQHAALEHVEADAAGAVAGQRARARSSSADWSTTTTARAASPISVTASIVQRLSVP